MAAAGDLLRNAARLARLRVGLDRGSIQPFIHGARDIRSALELAGDTKARWRWWPVYAAGDSATGLGFTLGEADIADVDEAGRPVAVHTQYMTLWRRTPDGAIRYLADIGGLRPARARRRP